MTATRLWLTLGGYWLVGAASVAVHPSAPPGGLPPAAAAACGAAGGCVLFVLLTRSRPRVPRRIAAAATLALAAAAEELVWRRLVLAFLLTRAPAAAAFVGATVLFALAHRGSRVTHLGTGTVFGGAYLGGGLIAAVAAHVVYNLASAGAAWRTR